MGEAPNCTTLVVYDAMDLAVITAHYVQEKIHFEVDSSRADEWLIKIYGVKEGYAQ